MTKRVLAVVVASSLAGVAACITVNIYFPAPEVRAAAQDIVEETWGDVKGSKPDSAVSPGARWYGATHRFLAQLSQVMGPSTAYAEQADINVSTAAIRALKASMKRRSAKL